MTFVPLSSREYKVEWEAPTIHLTDLDSPLPAQPVITPSTESGDPTRRFVYQPPRRAAYRVEGLIGAELAQGRYLLEQLIFQGGMGAVFRGKQIDSDREVAVKILSPELSGKEIFTKRFFLEAKILASMEHPYIIPVYDYGRDNEIYYIVMPYICGPNEGVRSLNDLIRQRVRLDLDTVLRVMEQTCRALDHVHKHGMVHRDIKPGNLLLDPRGNVRLSDFGIARCRNVPDDLTLTRTGVTLGSLRYISPEQRDDPGRVDHRSDLFSLGKVLYKMLTGQLPEGKYAKVSSFRPDIDKRIDRVIDKALMQDPEDRYTTATQFAQALRSLKKITESDKIRPRQLLTFGQLSGVSVIAGIACGFIVYGFVMLSVLAWPIAVPLLISLCFVLIQFFEDRRSHPLPHPTTGSPA